MILLDLDDTLIDHTSAERNAAALFGRQYANLIPGYDPHNFVQRWHEASMLHIEAFLQGEIDFQEQRRRRLRTIFKQDNMTASHADVLFSDYLEHYETSWQLFPDVIAFLNSHTGEYLAVLSDGAQEQQEAKLKKTEIRRYFWFVATAESIGFSKPDPRMFLHACDLGEAEPHEVTYIGDNLQKDAIGASQAGLRGVWLNRSGALVPAGVETISSLSEFVPGPKRE